jgi:hypothetical protein
MDARARYIVEIRHRCGNYLAEVDLDRTDRGAVLTDLLSGQYEGTVRVYRLEDKTAEFARAISQRCLDEGEFLRNHGFERSREPIARSVAFTLSGRTKCLSPDWNTADEPLSALPGPTRSRIPSNVPSCCRLPGCGCTYMTRWNTCQVTLSCRSTGPMTIASGNRLVVSAAVQPITVSYQRLL